MVMPWVLLVWSWSWVAVAALTDDGDALADAFWRVYAPGLLAFAFLSFLETNGLLIGQ